MLSPLADAFLADSTERLPDTKAGTAPEPQSSKPRILYKAAFGVLATLRAVCVIWALHSAIVSTGAVCPVAWGIWPLTPYLQMAMCALDVVILVHISRIRRSEKDDGRDASRFMSVLFFAAAACTAVIAISPVLVEISISHILRLNYVDIRDIFTDSCVATCVLLCAISLLGSMRPSTLALLGIGLGLFGFPLPNVGSGPLVPDSLSMEISKAQFMVAATTGILVFTAKPPENVSRGSTAGLVHRWIKLGYMGVACLCLLRTVLAPAEPSRMPLPAAINKLFQVAELDANQWAEKAATSKALKDAVAEYRRRYGIAPPPNFDKWYEFAKKRESPIIDSFDQIHNDLLPFWGVEPSEIRDQTAHLLSYASTGMGGLRIRGGVLQQSPHIPGTHRWMAEALDRMIQPFAKWLPDMDLVINLGDECRVTVPYEDKQALLQRASETRSRISTIPDGTKPKSWSAESKSNWPEEWTEPRGDFYAGTDLSPYFSSNIRKPLYYEWIAPTCPPNAPAHNSRWWDRSTACVDCIAPHSFLTHEGAVMAHAPMADDLCYQPDLAYLDGFIQAPTVVSTDVLLPVFSQARVGGFSDILFPSPWNYAVKSEYEESKDMNWADKVNTLFWRGSSSDGYAWGGSWTGFLRARFVNEGYQQTTSLSEGQSPGINVTFTGVIPKCHDADCVAERLTFSHWGKATLPPGYTPTEDDGPLPPGIPFEEHWHYRHLVDMDGAGFSGRFLPFLQSRSLVYRAALFKTWFDERLREWHHYVPVDVRLGRGFWSVVQYLGSSERHDASKRSGEEIAERIAQRGRDWASRALRAEDMQIYMFRLLLEWGRIVDDERETLGYAAG